MQHLSDANRETFFAGLGDRFALLYFGAAWCGPCRQLAPIIEQLDQNRQQRGALYLAPDKLAVAKIDIDHATGLATDFLVKSVPTCLVVNGAGKVVGVALVGAPPKQQFFEWLHKVLGSVKA